MSLDGEGTLLRVFLGESDQHQHRPLYDAIVLAAREAHLAGATVLRGVEGFGAASRLHSARLLRLSDDLPIIVEIVDTKEHIHAFLPTLRTLVDESGHGVLITEERVRVLQYGAPRD